MAEGTRFDPVITQFHYKDDPLHDPMLDDAYVDYIIESKGAAEYAKMREINAEALVCLEAAFARFDFQLVDMKLEYGFIGKELCIIDEVSGGSFRLWPYRHKNPNLNQPNVLGELNPHGRLDKDTYRMGERFEDVKSKFAEIARITANFKTLNVE
jgi:phosphoribosylaminoimidazole-succinocarboxamide synthase